MDYQFINKMVGSYINDNDSDLSKLKEYNDFVIDIVQETKKNDYNMYTYIHEELDTREQQKLVYSLLDEKLNKDDIDITEIGIMTAGLLTLGAALLAYKNRRKIINTLDDISNKINVVARKYNIRDRILRVNYNNCLDKCSAAIGGTNRASESQLDNSLMRNRNNIGNRVDLFQTEKSKEQADCLLNCHLDFITSVISRLAKDYKMCLINTGIDARDIDDDNILIFKPLDSVCYNLHDSMLDLNNDFIEVLDLIYGHDKRKQQEWVTILHYKIRETNAGRVIKPGSYKKFIKVSI